jgi:hypothetical protein
MDITRLGADVNRALIANNFVSVGASGNQGIRIGNSVYTDVFYNSVFMISPSNTSTAFYSAGGVIDGTVNIRNNNFSHQNSGYAIYIGAPDVINTIDYNNLYTAGNFISYWGGRRVINLRELQQSSGKNSNSLSVYPHYDAFDDLHTSAPWLDGRGTALPRVTTDFDGDLRDALAPDIGADEFTPDQATTTPLSGTYTIGSGGTILTSLQQLMMPCSKVSQVR